MALSIRSAHPKAERTFTQNQFDMIVPFELTCERVAGIGTAALLTASFCWGTGVVQLEPLFESITREVPSHPERVSYVEVRTPMLS